jgi:hypothetical protein
VLTAIVALGVAIWIGPRTHRVEVAAYLRVRSAPTASPLTRPDYDAIEIQKYRATQVELLRSGNVLRMSLRHKGIAQLSIVRDQPDQVAWLKSNLRIDYPNDSEILRVRLASWQPDEAVKVVNAVVDSYVQLCVSYESMEQKRHLDESRRVYDDLKQLATKRRLELAELARSHGDPNSANQLAEKDGELAGIEALIQQAFLRLEEAQLEAKMPPRVERVEPAELPEGW